MNDNSQQKEYSCPYCDEEFDTYEELEEHWQECNEI